MLIFKSGNKDLYNIVIKRFHRKLFFYDSVPGMQIVKDISLVKKNKGKNLKG